MTFIPEDGFLNRHQSGAAARQREMVQQSANMADSAEDRHGVYGDRRRQQRVNPSDDFLERIRVIVREAVAEEMKAQLAELRARRAAEAE